MKGVIFDMDGTIVDNMMIHHRIWQSKLNEMGLDFTLEETMEKAHGVNIEFLGRFFGDRYSTEDLKIYAAEKESEYRATVAKNMPLVPGIVELFEDLSSHHIPMAIGSAAPPENVDFVLDTAQLRHYFGSVYHSGNVSQGKPNPEVYHSAAAGLGLTAPDCIVIEDSPIGAKTAYNAGCPVVVITNTHPKEDFSDLDNVVLFIENYLEINTEILNQSYQTAN